MSKRQQLLDASCDRTRTLLFWLGAAYMTLVMVMMTPYTHQLDDIKVTLIHVLGPGLILAYLVALARGHVHLPDRKVGLPLLVFFVAAALSAMFTEDFARWKAWQGFWMQWVLLGPFLVFFAVSPGTRQLHWCMKFYVAITLFSNLFGIAHIHGGAPLLEDLYRLLFGRWDPADPPALIQLTGTFKSTGNMLSIVLNRNFYASFLLLAIPLAVANFLVSRSILWRILSALTILLSLYCIMQTKSKVSMYAAVEIELLLLVGLYLFWVRLPWRNHAKAVAIAAVGLAAAALLVLFNLETVLAKLSRFDASFISRGIIWQGAWRCFLDNPILGGGLGSFDMLFPFYRRPDYFLYEISHRTIFAHNYFLGLFSETGLVGGVAFLFFLSVLFLKNLAQMRRGQEPMRNLLMMGLVAGMTGFFINNATSPNARWPICAINLWAGLGMLAGAVRVPPERLTDQGPTALLPTLSPRARQIVWGIAALTLLGWLYTANYGIDYFRASMANNRGLKLVGNPPHQPGPIYLIQERLQEIDRALANENIAPNQRQQLQERRQYLQREYRRLHRMAVSHFERALEIQPSFTTSRYKVATLYFMGEQGLQSTKQDYEKSLDAYTELQRYGPRYSQIQLNLLSNYTQLRYEAEREAREARRQNDPVAAEAHEARARELMDQALDSGREAVDMSIDPQTNRLFLQLLVDAARKADTDQRRDTLQQEALRWSRRLVAAWKDVRAHQHRLSNRGKKNLNQYLEDTAQIFYAIALQVRDPQAIVDAARFQLQLQPDNPSRLEAVSQAYQRLDQPEKTEAFFRQRLQNYPRENHSRDQLALALIEQNRPDQALAEIQRIQSIDPQYPELPYLRFKLAEARDAEQEALQAARRYLQADPQGRRMAEVRRYLARQGGS